MTASPDFGRATGLVCRECGAEYSLGAAYACAECFGPLEVQYDFTGVTRAMIEAGPQSLVWDGTDLRGRRVSSGVYLYRVVGFGQEITQRMALVK